ncbi:MAG: 50S ribosome-binding GTPase, partial [Propionibacteriaceae bacterium]|nr:50S ribosome-binding GTPase [Propionibacteriaceae bacterium]
MAESLSTALTWLRDELVHVRLTVPLPGASQTKQWIASAVGQLDDYILPRLRSIEAPILAVVGGSTGAGKSTLVNSLLGTVVTIPGVIRPTTKAPVLIHHPADSEWFSNDRILPGLTRSAPATGNVRSLQIMSSTVVPTGLAILDTPDIDSVDEANRSLASQLLAAADLWIFVTSAARYADAVPWEYLTQAAGRSAAVAVVVDRVPPNAMAAVPEDLARMMTERGLGDSPLFAVPETVVNELGLLPSSAVQPIQAWLEYLASNQITRAQVVMRTLDGAMKMLESGVTTVAQHITQQNQAVRRLKTDTEAIFADAKRSVRSHSSDGTLLRGEVLARWQDFVGAGTFMTSVQTWVGRMRDRVARVFTGDPARADDVQIAVRSGLETLLIEAGHSAVERVAAVWSADPTGRFLIEWSGLDAMTV